METEFQWEDDGGAAWEEAVPVYIEDEQPTERLPVRERWSTEEMMELVKGSRP